MPLLDDGDRFDALVDGLEPVAGLDGIDGRVADRVVDVPVDVADPIDVLVDGLGVDDDDVGVRAGVGRQLLKPSP